MNKKLLAVAVAGALAAPGVALAQTSVTLSGFMKVGPDQVSYSRATPNVLGGGTQTGGPPIATRLGNQNETRVSDHASRIYFRAREELGNGLAAVMQIDLRVNPATSPNPTGSAWAQVTGNGSDWVGLDSKAWGRLTFGKHDLHYGKGGDGWNAGEAGHLQAYGSALFDFANRPTQATATAARGGVVAAIGNVTRTQQVIRWEAPNWQGFDGTIAYSANPLTAGSGGASTGGDLGVPLPGVGPNAGQLITRKGNGWNINPRYTARNWMIEYSYWNAKGDINSAGVAQGNAQCISAALGCTGATVVGATAGQGTIQDDQRADVLAGRVNWNNWTFGLAWNRAKTTNVASGLITGDRSAWELPISYRTGPHFFGFAYTKANDSKDVTIAVTPAAAPAGTILAGQNLSGADTGAKMFSLTYIYSLSQRTSLGLTWAQLTNSAAGTYNFFYNTPTAFGGANASPLPGERLQLLGGTIMHKF
jgi:predicted porin